MMTTYYDEVLARVRSRLRALRAQYGWSASELTRRLTHAGVPISRDVLANIETGRRDWGLVEALAAADLFGVSIVDLVRTDPLRVNVREVVID